MFEGSRSEHVVDRVGRMLWMDGMGWAGLGWLRRTGKKRDENKNTRADEKPLQKTPELISFMCKRFPLKGTS
jgi:hypothetical protein